MTNCEICGANCDHDINTIQTCTKCGLGNFHLILTPPEKTVLKTILNNSYNMFNDVNAAYEVRIWIQNMMEKLK